MEVVEIKSAALQATRKVTIYVPPGAAPKAGWPALITVGGAEIEPYLALIDALIEQKRIHPLVVVAVWDRPGDADGREYLRGKDPDAYIRHSMFVDREVMPIAVGRFGVTKDPARRLLFGVGGADRGAQPSDGALGRRLLRARRGRGAVPPGQEPAPVHGGWRL
jgi:enterochelin esterase-like enzyme